MSRPGPAKLTFWSSTRAAACLSDLVQGRGIR